MIEAYIATDESERMNKFRETLKKMNFKIDDKEMYMPINIIFWNSGVIGIPYTMRNCVNEILKITDAIYPLFCEPRLVEQLAFSYVFQKYGTIHPMKEIVYHYWYFYQVETYLSSILSKYEDLGLNRLQINLENINPVIGYEMKRQLMYLIKDLHDNLLKKRILENILIGIKKYRQKLFFMYIFLIILILFQIISLYFLFLNYIFLIAFIILTWLMIIPIIIRITQYKESSKIFKEIADNININNDLNNKIPRH